MKSRENSYIEKSLLTTQLVFSLFSFRRNFLVQIVTNNQPAAPLVSEGEGGQAQYLKPRNTGYVERRDHQHAMIWDQEPARMTFAEIPSAEETALIRLFEAARKHGHIADSQTQKCGDFEPASLPMPQSNSAVLSFEMQNWQDCNPLYFGRQNPNLQISVQKHATPTTLFASAPSEPETLQADIFAKSWQLDFSPRTAEPEPDFNARRKSISEKEATELAEGLLDLVGTETLRHVSSYEKLLRTTSYRVLEDQAGNLRDLPVSDCKRIDASLLKLVDSADRVSAKKYSHYLSTSAFRCQAFLSLHTVASAVPSELKKLRGLGEKPKAQASVPFYCSEAREALSNLWNRVVAKKNASLSLAVMRRKMRAH